MHAYLLAKAAFAELFLANRETDVSVTLAQKDVQGMLK